MDFTGKRVLVTGGTRGIGKATIEAFVAAGARVAVNGRTGASVARCLKSLKAGQCAIAAPGDIGTVNGCQAAVDAAVRGLDGLDVLVNSAGVGIPRSIEDSDEALWDATINVNLKGTFFCSRAALPALRTSKGNICNIASDAGLMGFPGATVYCASKGGVVSLTRAMALALAPTVRTNCVCPGFVNTDMVRRDYIDKASDPIAAERLVMNFAPLKRIAEPSEIATAVLYLASHEARNITGVALAIDGGGTAGR